MTCKSDDVVNDDMLSERNKKQSKGFIEFVVKRENEINKKLLKVPFKLLFISPFF
jgi:hypothetical protein